MAGAIVINSQATFATSGPYVTLPSGLFGSYTAVSVEAWVTTGVNNGWARIFQYGASATTNANSLAVNLCSGSCTSGNFLISWLDSAWSYHIGTTGVGFNSQTNLHLVMTVSAGDYARLYINGTLAGFTPSTVNPLPPATAFYLGKSFVSTDSGLIGSVNEFRIWGGALSATDISARYYQGPGEAATGLVLRGMFDLLTSK